MSQYLFYSDLHLRPDRIDDCKIALSKIGLMASKIQDKTKKQVTIVNGGDTFNVRGLINTHCFDILFKEYTKWKDKGLKQWIVVGNHDQEDKAGKLHPMNVFQTYDGWEVISKPRVVDDFAIFPYIYDKSELKKALGKYKAKDAIVHWGIEGAHRNDWNVDKDGVPSTWLSHFRNVFSGHYHYRNKFKNIQYIGSPFQQSFAEREQVKGVIYYNQKTQKQKFYEIKGTSKYHQIEIDQSFIEDGGDYSSGMPDIKERDFVKIKLSGDQEFCSTVKVEDLIECEARSIKIEREVKRKHYSRLNIDSTELLSPYALMEKYVDYVDTPLNKKKLLEIGKELLDGVHS